MWRFFFILSRRQLCLLAVRFCAEVLFVTDEGGPPPSPLTDRWQLLMSVLKRALRLSYFAGCFNTRLALI
jgi:hypothetical protein